MKAAVERIEGMKAKCLYREQYDREMMPLSYAPWLLDAVCGDHWEVVCVVEQGEIKAFLIFRSMKKRFTTLESILPNFGESPLWICSLEGWSDQEKVSKELEWLDLLIESLPNYDHLCIPLPSNLLNWLPFYWQGFEQKTMYSFELYLPVLETSTNRISPFTIQPWSIKEGVNQNVKPYTKRPFKYIERNKHWLHAAELHHQLLGLMAVGPSGEIVGHSFVMYNHNQAYEWYESSLKGEGAEQVRMQFLETWQQKLPEFTAKLILAYPNHWDARQIYQRIGAVPVRRLIVEHMTSPIIGIKQLFRSKSL
ncbi:hypothetical protein ACFQZR_26730 [Paenibacillus sp. GCM10027629]|uniref:hypothetical protein n=1 Tax=Paenibacillus sp. GCM10027629 TaxID=3273414 RepID=UPI0036384BD6